jgi:predicted aspartyl protease
MEYPLVEVAVAVGAWSAVGEALPDNGYSGEMIIPMDVALGIDTPPDQDQLFVADGRGVAVDAWDGELEFAGQTFRVSIKALGDRFIIGRQVLDQVEICFRFGREVAIIPAE